MLHRLPPEEGPRLLVTLTLAALGIIFIFTVTANRDPEGSYFLAGDGHYLAMTARSLAFDGDLDLSNQYRAWGDRWGLGAWPTDDGWRLPPRSIGPALIMVPGLWLQDLLGLARDPYGRWLSIGPALMPALCFWLVSFRLERAFPELAASRTLAASLIAVLAFVLPYYAWGRSAYPHAADAAGLCLLFFVLLRPEPKPVPVGLAIALCVLMRYQNALWLLWPAYLYAFPDREQAWPPRIRKLATLGLTASLGLLPTIYLAFAHPGSEVGVIRWGADFFNFDDYLADLGAVLFGVHGLFTWTPIVGLAALGLAFGAPDPRHRRGFALVFVAMWLLMASVLDPDGGTAFGARRLASYTPIIAWGLVALFSKTSSRSRSLELSSLAASGALCLHNLARTWQAIHGQLDLGA